MTTLFRIRDEQLARLAASRHEALVEELASRLRKQFPVQVSSLGQSALGRCVDASLYSAQRFGISANAHLYRFVCLCACFGWDFETRPESRWMLDMLRDPEITDPHSRLLRLYKECIRRLEIRLHNEQLRQRFGAMGADCSSGPEGTA